MVYCISSWWRDLSAVTVDPLGYPQMWREPSTSTGVYILYRVYIYIYRERTTTSLAIRGFDKDGTGYYLSCQPEILGQ